MRRQPRTRTLARMASVTPLMDLTHRHSEPAPFSPDTALPLRASDFDAGIATMLHEALAGARRADLLNGLCKHLARVLRLRLVLLARALQPGSLAMEGTSSENALWLELQRIPERWDSGVTSRGPAGEAIRAKRPIHMRLGDEGFALWRASA